MLYKEDVSHDDHPARGMAESMSCIADQCEGSEARVPTSNEEA